MQILSSVNKHIDSAIKFVTSKLPNSIVTVNMVSNVFMYLLKGKLTWLHRNPPPTYLVSIGARIQKQFSVVPGGKQMIQW